MTTEARTFAPQGVLNERPLLDGVTEGLGNVVRRIDRTKIALDAPEPTRTIGVTPFVSPEQALYDIRHLSPEVSTIGREGTTPPLEKMREIGVTMARINRDVAGSISNARTRMAGLKAIRPY